ncbi:MAG TPA: amidase family protein, partial [Gammaproteobacteria bacterium]|nr:amidase family protein [Gammaproteobacteria bacterium]
MDNNEPAPAESSMDLEARSPEPENDLPSLLLFTALFVVLTVLVPSLSVAQNGFAVEETTIAEVHAAIRSGETTCEAVVASYIERAQAYNGMCTALVTSDGAPIPPTHGIVRAGKPLAFPTETVPVSSVLPDFARYTGPPVELGRMETTASDPTVKQQVGMRVGIPNAGQLNALETLNIRGERSVTCKGAFDAHPSAGPLPADAPPECEAFRRQPDALERARELDALYGRNPDLDKLPMYCVVFSHKNWYDAKDIRSTGGNDVSYAMDVPPVDSPDIADLREKGAIIYAAATAAKTGLSYDGAERAKSWLPDGNYADAAWGGQPCNPYDTERVPRGTSSGSGVSVSANLVQCSICEQGSASCKGPASRNNIVNFLTTRGLMMHGGMNSQRIGDRAGIHCRTVEDAARVLDAVKGFDTEDMFTAIPQRLMPQEPYSSFVVDATAAAAKPLAGMRIGVVREFMVKHTKNDEAISDQLDREIKAVLRDELGAELVESSDPLYPDDPDVPNMKYTFRDAFAEILAHNVPEYFWQTGRSGELRFAVPGWDVRTTDYAIALALGLAPLSPEINLRTISSGLDNFKSPFTVNKYLRARGDRRVIDWASFVANSRFQSDAHRAGSVNAIGIQDLRPDEGDMSYLKMRIVLQHVVQKVMLENDIDVFVNPENTLPPPKIGGPAEPAVRNRGSASCCQAFTALLGGPEIDVPAGYTQVAYEPRYELNDDGRSYRSVSGTVASRLPYPMPISLMVWAGPGTDPEVIKVAS